MYTWKYQTPLHKAPLHYFLSLTFSGFSVRKLLFNAAISTKKHTFFVCVCLPSARRRMWQMLRMYCEINVRVLERWKCFPTRRNLVMKGKGARFHGRFVCSDHQSWLFNGQPPSLMPVCLSVSEHCSQTILHQPNDKLSLFTLCVKPSVFYLQNINHVVFLPFFFIPHFSFLIIPHSSFFFPVRA